MLFSGIYEGTIRHRRFHPVDNRFQYRIFFMYLDLAELDRVFDLHPLWSLESPNLAVFRRRDHLGDPRLPMDHAIRAMVAAATGETPDGPIRMLTHLRYFGYCFNPVSFFYCWRRGAEHPEWIVAEVRNTPWLETHGYVFGSLDNRHPLPEWRTFAFPKAFHVSPFMEMDLDYEWRFRVPGPRLSVHMINRKGGRRIFDATLSLQRRELTRAAMTDVLVRYPLMTAQVTARIYRQAFRLWRKNAPFFVHPRKRFNNTRVHHA